MWAHAGGFSKGARTLVQLIPARQIGIVVLTNPFPTGFPEGIAASFFDIVFDGNSLEQAFANSGGAVMTKGSPFQ